MERSESSRGMPFISISSGMVTSRSTSSEACPGHWVMISTCGGERSGYASMGSFWKDHAPQTIMAMAATTTTKGWFSAKVTSLAIIGILY